MARMSRVPPPALDGLLPFARASRRLLVLTGAGCSTESGIADYRDEGGAWKRSPPIQLREFLDDDAARRRYWTRSFHGWPRVANARPGGAHRAIARLERAGLVGDLITQNVDGLHGRAGSRTVLELHGSLADVECRDCGAVVSRAALQARLAELNPWVADAAAAATGAPDGDADVTGVDTSAFEIPACEYCGGLLKPAVVFFGESVPRARVERAIAAVHAADAVLAVGTSLMVWSGYRLIRLASELGLSIAIVNLGVTRADDRASVRVNARCGDVLEGLADALGA
jgi:NAD-dependent SIR2 family protein deacetylase